MSNGWKHANTPSLLLRLELSDDFAVTSAKEFEDLIKVGDQLGRAVARAEVIRLADEIQVDQDLKVSCVGSFIRPDEGARRNRRGQTGELDHRCGASPRGCSLGLCSTIRTNNKEGISRQQGRGASF